VDALLDGQAPPPNADATSPARKLARLQHAFAALQWAELEPEVPAVALFQWGHLAAREAIGTGGFGEVFRAYDSMLQREVALKLRRAGNQIAPAAGRAFIEEARRLAQVRHPNVLAVHGAAVHDGRAGIWTDLIVGETLAARVASTGVLSAAELLQLLDTLSDALAVVHARGIVHGDLTPLNVMCESESGRFVLMDFGGGASLDHSGSTRLGAGSLHFMAPEQLNTQLSGTSADLYALGATVMYAATRQMPDAPVALKSLRQRSDVPAPLAQLILELVDADPASRPTAPQAQQRCRVLFGAPERAHRQRLRRALILVLAVGMLATSWGMLSAWRASQLAQAERTRAVAASDFLLTMIRAPNPAQARDGSRSLADMFEKAVRALPEAFADDPKTEAVLLSQFGRSLQMLDRDEEAAAALERADRLLDLAEVPLADAQRVETRANLSGIYRHRRDYPKAIALAEEQVRLCRAPTQLPARSCLYILNDQVQALGFGGFPLRALQLADENLTWVRAAGLDADDRTAYLIAMQGSIRQNLGEAQAARASYLRLAERSLTALDAEHPGLLLVLTYLAASADDIADVGLARELNDHALRGYTMVYGEDSHYTVRTRLMAAAFALHGGDPQAARTLTTPLLHLPPSAGYATWIERATVLAALSDDVAISEAQLAAVELSRLRATGAESTSLAELRLDLAAVALRRGLWQRANELLDSTRDTVLQERSAGLQPLYWQLKHHAEVHQPNADSGRASAARDEARNLLQQQRRRLFDPVAARWVGEVVPDAQLSAARIRLAADRVVALRASAQARS
jgi:tetratricopeptide (TPR) repeat protein